MIYLLCLSIISWAFLPGTAIIVELIEECKVKDAVIRLISIPFVHRATDELIWRWYFEYIETLVILAQLTLRSWLICRWIPPRNLEHIFLPNDVNRGMFTKMQRMFALLNIAITLKKCKCQCLSTYVHTIRWTMEVHAAVCALRRRSSRNDRATTYLCVHRCLSRSWIAIDYSELVSPSITAWLLVCWHLSAANRELRLLERKHDQHISILRCCIVPDPYSSRKFNLHALAVDNGSLAER